MTQVCSFCGSTARWHIVGGTGCRGRQRRRILGLDHLVEVVQQRPGSIAREIALRLRFDDVDLVRRELVRGVSQGRLVRRRAGEVGRDDLRVDSWCWYPATTAQS